MASLATIATVATIGAAVVGTGAAIWQGMEQQKAQEAAARQDERNGREEFAASQRTAEERRLEGALISSRQLAAAAASGAGAGADAPTIVKILGDTDARTKYGVQSELYAGRERMYDSYDSASARRATGRNNFFGGLLKGLGRGLGGVGDVYGLQT